MARKCATEGWTDADFGWCDEAELDIQDLLVASRERPEPPANQETKGWGLRPEDLRTILTLVGLVLGVSVSDNQVTEISRLLRIRA